MRSWSTIRRAASRSRTTSASSIRPKPDFIARFIRGHMRYQLVALPLREDLAYYRDVGRGVSIQWLDLTPAAGDADWPTHSPSTHCPNTRTTATTTSPTTARPACATRSTARSVARLQRQLSARSRGNSYRSEAVRLASPAPWMWLGFDIGLGPFADVPLSRWQEAFVPMRLADSLREATRHRRPPAGRVANRRCCRIASPPEPAEYARPWWPWLLWGIAIAHRTAAARPAQAARAGRAGVAVVDAVRAARPADAVHLVRHRASRRLGQPEPAAVQSAVPAVAAGSVARCARPRRGRAGSDAGSRSSRSARSSPGSCAGCRFPEQDNTHWIALLLPIHLALFAACAAGPGRVDLAAGAHGGAACRHERHRSSTSARFRPA